MTLQSITFSSISKKDFLCAVKESFSVVEVLRKLNLPILRNAYDDFKLEINNIQLDISHFDPHAYTRGRFKKSKYFVPEDLFISSIKESLTTAQALIKMGIAPVAGAYNHFNLRVKMLQIDTSHFTGQRHTKGKIGCTNRVLLSELLVEDSIRTLTVSYKKRIIREGLLENKCDCCGLGCEWQGKPISLQIDHINGNHLDHRIENLRILCPNCHSQTDTFCSKNIKRQAPKKKP